MNSRVEDAPTRPGAVVAAAVLVCCYGLVLLVVGADLTFELVTGNGAIGNEHLPVTAARGVLFVSAALTVAACSLATGAFRAWRGRNPAPILVPLALLLVFGTIGEIADGVGGASATSELIGAGILVLAALPIALLLAPRSRAWWHRPSPTR